MKHIYFFYLRKIYLPQFAVLLLGSAATMLIATQEFDRLYIVGLWVFLCIYHGTRICSYGIAPQFNWLSQQGFSRTKLMICSLLFFVPTVGTSGLVGWVTVSQVGKIGQKHNLRPAEKTEKSGPRHAAELASPRSAYFTATALPMIIPIFLWWVFASRNPAAATREPIRTNWYHPKKYRFFRPAFSSVAAMAGLLTLYGPFEGHFREPFAYILLALFSVLIAWWGTALARECFVLSRRTTFRLRVFAGALHSVYFALVASMFTSLMKSETGERDPAGERSVRGHYVAPIEE